MSDAGENVGQDAGGDMPPPPPGSAPEPPPDAGYGAPPPAQEYGAPPPAQEYGAPQQGYAQPANAGPPAVAPMQNMAGAGAPEDTSSAVIAHVLALVAGILGTGIYYAVTNEKSPFVRHHVTEALNFSITVLIAWVATTILSFLLIGLLIIPFLFLWQLILPIMAAMAANKGEWYRYPATLRLVKGPLDQPGMA